MGERAEILIVEPDESRLFFYSHWDGPDLTTILQAALLRGKSRWGDSPYLARIIFNEMTQGCELETTGYGISTKPMGGTYPLIVVDMDLEVVTFENHNKTSWTFEEYVELDSTELPSILTDR